MLVANILINLTAGISIDFLELFLDLALSLKQRLIMACCTFRWSHPVLRCGGRMRVPGSLPSLLPDRRQRGHCICGEPPRQRSTHVVGGRHVRRPSIGIALGRRRQWVGGVLLLLVTGRLRSAIIRHLCNASKGRTRAGSCPFCESKQCEGSGKDGHKECSLLGWRDRHSKLLAAKLQDKRRSCGKLGR